MVGREIGVVHRWITIAAAVLIQACIGSVYAWSVFVLPLQERYGLGKGASQMVFGGLVAVLSLMMIPAGRLQARYGSRAVALVGGVLYSLGYLAAASSGGRFWWLLLGIAVIAGTGVSLTYLSTLTACQQALPERKGLATGLAMGGYAAGAILVASLARPWLERGTDPLAVFRVMALIYLPVILLAALGLRVSPARSGDEAAGVPPPTPFGELWRDRVFRQSLLGMFAGTSAGLLVIGNLKPMGLSFGASAGAATLAVSMFALGNAIGRVAWGRFYDAIGSRALPLALGGSAVTIFLLPFAPGWFPLAAALVGFSYGANFVLHPARIADAYGLNRLGAVYPLVFLAHGLAALTGPPLGGLLYDWRGSYHLPVFLAAGVAAMGIPAVLLPRRPARDH